eukprot:scaffold65839_cov36-Prasinocladus_malaysianus.AAC.1
MAICGTNNTMLVTPTALHKAPLATSLGASSIIRSFDKYLVAVFAAACRVTGLQMACGRKLTLPRKIAPVPIPTATLGTRALLPKRHNVLQFAPISPSGQQAAVMSFSWAAGSSSDDAPLISLKTVADTSPMNRREVIAIVSTSILDSSEKVSWEAATVQWSEISRSSVAVIFFRGPFPFLTVLGIITIASKLALATTITVKVKNICCRQIKQPISIKHQQVRQSDYDSIFCCYMLTNNELSSE